MIPIRKSTEPTVLTGYRVQPGAVYDGPNFTPVKNAIREQLVREQGYLCAYCMSRIEPNERQMKVEHWMCQNPNSADEIKNALHASRQLDYSNMLGCCCGMGANKSDEYCDTAKKNEDILLNPSATSDHAKLKIKYSLDGTISSEDTTFNSEINNVLNLNYSRLKENRASVWKVVTMELQKISGTASRPQIQNILTRWKTRKTDKLPPYCGVGIYYLEKKLQRTR